MKKLFVSILALAAFAACQSNFDDVTANTPGMGEQVVPEGMVRIYAEVGVGEEDTKATYGDDLSALWEENDQIALLQESANYGEAFTTVNKLNIKSGAGTSKAAFNGDIVVPTESPRIYHIAYPADAVSFSTSSTLTKSSESTYTYSDTELGDRVARFTASASFEYQYNSTLNITVPTKQNGKWEPYMYASTEEAVNSNAIGAKILTTLTGAIAVRAYKPNEDGTKTPLQLKAIAVTATKPIAGAFSGTAQSVGSLGTVTGDTTPGKYSTVSEGDVNIGITKWEGMEDGRNDSDNLLLAKAQSMTPASVDPTGALSLSFAGNEYTVGAEDTEWVAADNDGNYTYYLNVAPFENADLTIMATAIDGSTLIRSVSAQTLVASQRKGYNFTWEEATLSVGGIESWYDDYAKSNFELAGNTLYVRNLEVKGVPADQVTAVGVRVYDANDNIYKETAEEGVLSLPQVVVSDVQNGTYTICAYAKVTVNGKERELIGSPATKNVTSIPSLTNYSVLSSYSKDGAVAKNNSIDGHLLKVTASLSDDYFVNNGLATIEVYNGDTPLGNITNGEWSEPNAALGQYGCYVKISFTNGHLITSDEYETHVTGIPYSFQFYKSSNNAITDAGWTRNGSPNVEMELLCLRSGGAAGSNSGWVASPACHIPNNIPNNILTATVTLNSKYYVAAISASGNKANVYVGATSSKTSSSSSASTITLSGTNNTDSAKAWTESTTSVNMPSGTQYISINHNGATYWLGSRIYVATYKIEYDEYK